MRLFLLLVVSLFLSIPASAQNGLKAELDIITTTEHAEQFIENHKKKGTKLITFNEEKHKTRLAKELFKVHQGGTKVIKNEIESVHYKVIEKTKIPHFRVSYVYLDGKSLSASEIEILRSKIIDQYTSGVPFSTLAKTYSMDRSAKQGGDLGWFTRGEMMPEFETAVIDSTHEVDDIFTVDVVSKQWYYVVLKTYDPKNITEIKVLKVVESKR